MNKAPVVGLAALALAAVSFAQSSDAVSREVKVLKENAEPLFRMRAAKALGKMGRRAAASAEALTEALKDEDMRVRRAAAEALGKIGSAGGGTGEALILALKDADPYVRGNAASALVKVGIKDEKAVAALSEVLGDAHKYPRRAAAEALGQIGPEAKDAVNALGEAISDPDPYVRKAAAAALARIYPSGEDAVDHAALLLRSKDPQIRVLSVKSLAKLSPVTDRIDSLLVQALADGDPNVRLQAVSAFGARSTPPKVAVAPLCRAIGDENLNIAIAAVGPVSKLKPPPTQILPDLMELLGRPYDAWPGPPLYLSDLSPITDRISKTICRIAGASEPEAVLPYLITVMERKGNGETQQSRRSEGRAACVEAAMKAIATLGEKGRAAIPAITGALKDKEENVRNAAVMALIALDPSTETVLPSIREALKDGKTPAAASAFRSLGLKDPKLVPDLVAVFRAGRIKDAYRLDALAVLESMGPAAAEAVPDLMARLYPDREHDEVSVACAKTLGAMGHAAKAAVPELVKALKSPNRELRGEAEKALAKIAPGDPNVSAALDGSETLIAIAKHELEYGSHDGRAHAVRRLGQAKQKKEAADFLINECMRNFHDNVRRSAVEALGQLGPVTPQVVPALIRALRDENKFVREDSAESLGNIGPEAKAAAGALIEALKDDYEPVRVSALHALKKVGLPPRRLISVAVLVLTKPDAHITEHHSGDYAGCLVAAAKILGEFGPEATQAIPALLQAGRSRCEAHRDAAIEALESIGGNDAEALAAIEKLKHLHGLELSYDEVQAKSVGLLAGLADPDVKARRRAARELSRLAEWLSADEICPPLIAALKDRDAQVRCGAAAALGRKGKRASSAAAALLDATKDEEPSVRRAAVLSLAKVAGAEEFDAVIAALKDKDMSVSGAAVIALTEIHRYRWPYIASAASDLIKHLAAEDPQVRRAAADCLGEAAELHRGWPRKDRLSGSPKQQPARALIPAARDSSWIVRMEACRALRLLGPPAAVATEALVDALEGRNGATDDRGYLKREAALALAAIGPEAGEAVPALLRALDAEDWYVRRNVIAALRAIARRDKNVMTKAKEASKGENWFNW